MSAAWIPLANGAPVELARVPVLPVERFAATLLEIVRDGGRLVALFARRGPESRPDGGATLHAVLAVEETGKLLTSSAAVGASYPSLTPFCPQAQAFERDIAESCGVRPEGHPWLKPLRFPGPAAGAPPCGVTAFFRIAGEEIHEVAVGPVHAGVIEPGHFRFQCHGETVHHLEISLGYQHRGVERSLAGGPDLRSLPLAETLAGDTSIGHATSFSRICEGLAGLRVPARAQVLRGLALELERIVNHIGDLGALAGDTGFLPTAAWCGRIRGDALNMTAVLCGNRFGRNLVRPGGCAQDIGAAEVDDLRARLAALRRDATSAVELFFETPSAAERLDGIGALDRDACQRLGLVGPAARACGVARDVRRDFPYGIFRFAQLPVCTWDAGDVFGRAYVRWLEAQQSMAFIDEQLQALPAGSACTTPVLPPLAPERLIVSLVEGWRGEICHAAVADADGRFASYKVFDPSIHNWFGLACALREQQISDFPLCNKSFNLSYCGHDL